MLDLVDGVGEVTIAVTSNKYMFHYFCLAKALKETSSCAVCRTMLHSDWWLSWGLQPLTTELEASSLDLGLANLKENMKQSLRLGLGSANASPLSTLFPASCYTVFLQQCST